MSRILVERMCVTTAQEGFILIQRVLHLAAVVLKFEDPPLRKTLQKVSIPPPRPPPGGGGVCVESYEAMFLSCCWVSVLILRLLKWVAGLLKGGLDQGWKETICTFAINSVLLQELRSQEEYETFYKTFVTGDLVDVAGAATPYSCLNCRMVVFKPVLQGWEWMRIVHVCQHCTQHCMTHNPKGTSQQFIYCGVKILGDR
jgi:hypothetical protein